MKNVVLHRSQLICVSPDDLVFDRPIQMADDCLDAALKKADAKVRYEAWEAVRFVIGGAAVYAGVCEGRKVYVIVPHQVYNEVRQPQRVRTKDEDDEKRLEAEAEQRRAEKAKQKMERKQAILAKFEIIPKEHAGVDYGIEQRVLIRTKDKVLTWRPGVSSYLDRGSGTVYASGELNIYRISPSEKGAPGSDLGTLGYKLEYYRSVGKIPIKLPNGFRYGNKALLALRQQIEPAMDLRAGALDNWKPDQTLVLEEKE